MGCFGAFVQLLLSQASRFSDQVQSEATRFSHEDRVETLQFGSQNSWSVTYLGKRQLAGRFLDSPTGLACDVLPLCLCVGFPVRNVWRSHPLVMPSSHTLGSSSVWTVSVTFPVRRCDTSVICWADKRASPPTTLVMPNVHLYLTCTSLEPMDIGRSVFHYMSRARF